MDVRARVSQAGRERAIRDAFGQYPAVPVQDCRTPDGPRGAGHATMLFSPEGIVGGVTLTAPFAGTAEGTCIEARFRQGRIAPFSGTAPVRVGKSFVIN